MLKSAILCWCKMSDLAPIEVDGYQFANMLVYFGVVHMIFICAFHHITPETIHLINQAIYK